MSFSRVPELSNSIGLGSLFVTADEGDEHRKTAGVTRVLSFLCYACPTDEWFKESRPANEFLEAETFWNALPAAFQPWKHA
jgi:hypothetical protein